MVRRIQVIAGTRPEVLKLAPVIEALRRRSVLVELVVTGQQGALLETTLAEVGLVPDVRVTATGAGLAGTVGGLLAALGPVVRGDVVVVHGDTSTALAGALSAFYAGILVAHVEAGLRSGVSDRPFPEEAHRVLIDRLATWWFAPTTEAGATLLAEGCAAERVHVVGNTVVDALQAAKVRGGVLPAEVEAALGGDRPVVLVTCHRGENRGAPMGRVAEAMRRLAEDHVVVALRHPHPATAGIAEAATMAVGPLAHGAFVRLLERADVVLTDSGGVQEECVALGRRALVLREETERPEGVVSGHLVLVGTGVEGVLGAVRAVEGAVGVGVCPYGDGDAGERVADHLVGRNTSYE